METAVDEGIIILKCSRTSFLYRICIRQRSMPICAVEWSLNVVSCLIIRMQHGEAKSKAFSIDNFLQFPLLILLIDEKNILLSVITGYSHSFTDMAGHWVDNE